jgi:hypothetical protein
VRNRNDNDRFILDAIYDGIRKTLDQGSANFTFYFRTGQREVSNKDHGAMNSVEELQTLSGSPLLEPAVSIIKFFLRDCEESDVH